MVPGSSGAGLDSLISSTAMHVANDEARVAVGFGSWNHGGELGGVEEIFRLEVGGAVGELGVS